MRNERVEHTQTTGHETQGCPRLRRPLIRALVPGGVILAAVILSGAWDPTRAQDRLGGSGRIVRVPVAAYGLVAGDGVRTTVTNIGTSPVTVQALVVDADGAEVERATLTIPPGASRSLETSRSELSSSDLSAMTYTSILTPQADRDRLMVSTALIDWATGVTRTGSGGCTASFACGSNGNHNETLLSDTDHGGAR